MTDKQNILLLCGSLPTKRYPSNAQFEIVQAQALNASGMNVVIGAVDLRSVRRLRRYGITKGFYGVGGGTIEGWSITNVPLGRFPVCVLESVGNWEAWRLYRHMFKGRSRPGVIHAHYSLHAGLLGKPLAERLGIPLVITEHASSLLSADAETANNRASLRAYRSADKVIAVSRALARRIYDLCGVECAVIHNVVDPERLFSGVRRNDTPGFGFITAGNLIPIKNHSILLEAFAGVHAHHSDARLGILGTGPLDKSLKAKAVRLGIAGAVKFYGWLPHSEMVKVYRSYDCFVFPSNVETFGVALAEGMAAGMPVIATRCGGPEDFVSDEYGILTQPGSLQELTEAMMNICEHRKRYDSQKSRDYIKRKFSPQVIAGQLMEIYERVCSEQSGRK